MSIPPPPGPGAPEPGNQGGNPFAPPGPGHPTQGPTGPYGPPGQAPTGPYGAHPPGPGGGYGTWPPPHVPYVRPPVNGFAIAALVLGILCVPLVGLVFGVLALLRIHRTGERGKGMAIWGVVLSGGSLVLWGLAVLGALSEGWDAASDAARPVFTVATGECFTVRDGDLIGVAEDVDEEPCGGPHDGEAFSTFRMDDAPGDPYPGEEAIVDRADAECTALRPAYAMDSWALPPHVEVYYFTPTREGWELGDRQITCMFGHEDAGQQLTGSLRNDGTVLDRRQRAFLEVARPVEEALLAPPEATYVENDLPGHRKWAAEVARAMGRQVTRLSEAGWSKEGAGPVTAYAERVDAARAEWDRAARAEDAETFYVHLDTALELSDPALAVPSRAALGLGTTPPRELVDVLGDPEGAAGSDGAGPGAGAAV
ncbi:DUF4190 domain-containing protein [Streptomyces sp. NPDC002490]|uniref:DUF4190 domain-containing protein n=1 Tax=Streptomyces sp. NPDC002490 TaxID=3154416 RepID=UPI00331FD9E7